MQRCVFQLTSDIYLSSNPAMQRVTISIKNVQYHECYYTTVMNPIIIYKILGLFCPF